MAHCINPACPFQAISDYRLALVSQFGPSILDETETVFFLKVIHSKQSGWHFSPGREVKNLFQLLFPHFPFNRDAN